MAAGTENRSCSNVRQLVLQGLWDSWTLFNPKMIMIMSVSLEYRDRCKLWKQSLQRTVSKTMIPKI